MLIFWLAATLLAAVALGLLLWPLLRRGDGAAAPDADSAAIAVYRDQKQALDAECADGVISTSERDAAVAELAHRLGDELAASPVVTGGGHRQRLAWGVALALLLLVPSAAVVLYARLGNPAATTVAAAIDSQNGHEMSASQITAMVDRLAERLKSHPDEAQGWVLLARSYAALGRYAEAADAYAHADALIPDNADLLADYADALAMAQGKRLAGKPAELAQRALTLDPQHKKGLALAASAALEARDFNAALAYWRRLLAQVPEGSDDAKQINAILAEVEAARDGQGPAAAAAKVPRRNVQVAAAPASAAPAPTAPVAAPVAATIAGRVDIAPDLAAKVALSDTVFIYARAVDGPRMPLAVLRVPARELPKQFRLDDSMGMAPGVKLSNAAAVIVEARISKSGNALPQPGDLSGKSAPVKPGANDVNITIDQVVP